MSATIYYNNKKIITTYDNPPIPLRSLDWSAVYDGYDGADDAEYCPVGIGATEALAILDLIQKTQEQEL